MSEQQWKVVPAEPTEEMVSVFSEMLEAVDDGCSSSGKDLLRKFIATIAAAPQPPALGGEPVEIGIGHDDVIEELLMMANMADDSDDRDDHLMYMRWVARIRTADANVARLQALAEQLAGGDIADLQDTRRTNAVLTAEVQTLQSEVERLTELAHKQAEAMRLIVVKRKTTVAEIRSMANRAFNESRAELAEGAKS